MANGRPGRPTLLTPELHASLCEDREGPLPDKDVCIKNGVDSGLVRLWVKDGLRRNAQEPFKSFAMEWCQAKIRRKEDLLAIIDTAMKKCREGEDPKARGDYKAATWLLERAYPLEFGSMVQLRGKQDGDINIEEILMELEGEGESLDSVLLNPPQPLLDAMRRNISSLRELLDELEAETTTPLLEA